MDIRNFFSKKKGSSEAKKPSRKQSPTPQKKRKEVSPADFFGQDVAPAAKKRPSATVRNDAPPESASPNEPNETKKSVNYFSKKALMSSTPSVEKQESSPKKRASKSPLKDKSVNPPSKKESRNNDTKKEPAICQQPMISEEEPQPKKKRVSASPAPKKPPPKLYTVDEITEQATFDMNSAKLLCLEGLAFCCSGVLDDLDRDAATDMIKTLGGRVTSTVSSKTHYLILGSLLEDGRPAEQGKKYQRAATESNCSIVRGTRQLYGLLQKYSGPISDATSLNVSEISTKKAPPTKNPYAQKPSNPYASNPYSKKPAVGSASPPPPTTSKAVAKSTGANDLWVDKYKPSISREILGNTESVKKLSTWLKTWEDRFNTQQAAKTTFSSPKGPWKAALLSGPPGIGKTTTAMVVASENGRDVLEFNASDVRSKKALQQQVGDITGSATLQFSTTKAKMKRCIIMDEVDGMGAGDRSGVSELIQMIKRSKVPIICICNDRQSQKLKSLIPYCTLSLQGAS